MAGEFDLIGWIRTQQARSDLVRVTAGDDLAVLSWAAQDLLLIGVDQVLDGVHFNSNAHSPGDIGRKVMNRNLSDCAAMACLPAAAVATVALPAGTGLTFGRELYLGMKQAADRFSCAIVGGDTASWSGRLVMTVTILGKAAGIEPVLRSGARPGDAIYVTGALGGSILGRHMSFIPRIEEARALARGGRITSMIDISDGLSRDLRHLCEQSGTGARISANAVPVHEDARVIDDGRAPLEHALHDGEDHELLFTCADEPQAGSPVPVTRIGTMTAQKAILLENADGTASPLEPRGWEHKL